MLWKCSVKYSGTDHYVDEIRYSEGSLKVDTQDIVSMEATKLLYKSDSHVPPFFYTSYVTGKKYLMPMWIEVHPLATLDDVKWDSPKPKLDNKVYKVKDYIIKYNPSKKIFVCNCQGYFRVKDKTIGCKHIQQLKTEKQI